MFYKAWGKQRCKIPDASSKQNCKSNCLLKPSCKPKCCNTGSSPSPSPPPVHQWQGTVVYFGKCHAFQLCSEDIILGSAQPLSWPSWDLGDELWVCSVSVRNVRNNQQEQKERDDMEFPNTLSQAVIGHDELHYLGSRIAAQRQDLLLPQWKQLPSNWRSTASNRGEAQIISSEQKCLWNIKDPADSKLERESVSRANHKAVPAPKTQDETSLQQMVHDCCPKQGASCWRQRLPAAESKITQS